MLRTLVTLLALTATAFGAQNTPGNYALTVGKLVTVNDADQILMPGMLLITGGKLTYIGAPADVPDGYEHLDFPDSWAMPGMVDLHTHIHTGTWGDINDMVRAVNPEFRTSPTIRASNPKIRVACASGVTTLLGIPGSGTNIGGFGVLYKSKTKSGYEGIVLADVGGMKVAQDSNPSRRAGDFGLSRAAMGWILEDVMQRAIAANEQGRRDPALMNLQRVANKEVPVLIHTAGAEGVINTARMWRVTFDTRSVLSHGSFDGWKVAPALGEIGIPINHGPRTMDYRSSRNGKINGSAAIYSRTKSPNFSLNTDSGVIPQEEFFLQGSMAARYDGDPYTMVRALTANPAKAFGIEDRVGSLEVGKDADVVIRTGDPLDPRAAVELVLIDGEIQYERKRGSQWF